jgi:hypothetical protein
MIASLATSQNWVKKNPRTEEDQKQKQIDKGEKQAEPRQRWRISLAIAIWDARSSVEQHPAMFLSPVSFQFPFLPFSFLSISDVSHFPISSSPSQFPWTVNGLRLHYEIHEH